MASAAVIPPSDLGRRNQAVIKPVGPPPPRLNSRVDPAPAADIPPPTLEQMLQLTDNLKARTFSGKAEGLKEQQGIPEKKEAEKIVDQQQQTHPRPTAQLATPTTTASLSSSTVTNLEAASSRRAQTADTQQPLNYFDFLFHLPPTTAGLSTDSMLASLCADPHSLQMNSDLSFNINDFIEGGADQAPPVVITKKYPNFNNNKEDNTLLQTPQQATGDIPSPIPDDVFLDQFGWMNDASAPGVGVGVDHQTHFDFYSQDTSFINLFGHELDATCKEAEEAAPPVVQMADLNRLVAPVTDMEGVVYVREEAESDDGVETEAEAEAEAAVVKREEAPAGKRATRKARTAAAAAPASTPPAAAAATPAPAAAPAADKTPPVKRGRGRPRKVAAVAAVAAAAAPPPASKKRKASDALAPASTPAVAVFAENNNINNNTNENNNSDDDDDELSFYLRMAEAATGSGPHLDAPQPLLSRPLKPAQAEALSLHKFKPLRPMDPELAKQYLALKDPSLNSKERRQLRNKLSARSFRERRKEYIDTLEAELRRIVNENVAMQDQVAAANAERDMYKALVDELQSKLGGLKLESTDTIMEESESTAPASSSTAAPSSASASASATTTKPAAKPKECRPTRGVRNFDNPISVHSVAIPEIPLITPHQQQTPVNSLTAWLHDQHISNHSLPHHFDEIDVPKRIGNLAYSKVELPIQPPQQLSVPRFVSAESVDDDVDTLCGEEETDMIALVPVAEPVDAPVASGEDDDDDDESLQGDEGTDVDPLTQLLESLDVGRLSPTSNDFTLMRLLDRKL